MKSRTHDSSHEDPKTEMSSYDLPLRFQKIMFRLQFAKLKPSRVAVAEVAVAVAENRFRNLCVAETKNLKRCNLRVMKVIEKKPKRSRFRD